MNYYPFHIGDYLSATRHLSWEEDAAYRRLLDCYYTSEKPLPSELRAVCRLVLASTDSQREAVQQVLSEFFELTELGWAHHRADKEIHAMRDKQQKQRDKANKRWNKPAAESGNADAMPRHKKADAVAQEKDADAMPPTPTPTPTPTPKEKKVQTPGAVALKSADLIAEGVEKQHADDWLAIRKQKRSPLTVTALEAVKREAAIAGMTLAQAVQVCAEKGWQGFSADWLKENTSCSSSLQKPSRHKLASPETFKNLPVDGDGNVIF